MNFKNSFFFRWISSYVTNLRYDPKPKFQKNFIWKLKKMFLSKNNKIGPDFSCWQLFSQFDLQFDLKPSMLPKLRVVGPWFFLFFHTYAKKTKFSWKKSKASDTFFIPFFMNLDLQSWSLAFYVTQTRHFKSPKHCFFLFSCTENLNFNKEKKSKSSQSYYKVLLMRMGYKYSFLFCFFPLMLLIWDCTQSQNFKNISYQSWKRFFCQKITKTAQIFMFTTLFPNFTFNLILNLLCYPN